MYVASPIFASILLQPIITDSGVNHTGTLSLCNIDALESGHWLSGHFLLSLFVPHRLRFDDKSRFRFRFVVKQFCLDSQLLYKGFMQFGFAM